MSYHRHKPKNIHNRGLFATIRNRTLRNILESSTESRKQSCNYSQIVENNFNGSNHSRNTLMSNCALFTFRTLEVLKKPGQGLGLYLREGNGVDRTDGVFISRIASDGAVAMSVYRDILLHGNSTSNHDVANNKSIHDNHCTSIASDDRNVVQILRTGDEIYAINGNAVVGRRLEDVVVNMSIQKKLVLTIRRPQFKQSTDEFYKGSSNNNVDESKLKKTSTGTSLNSVISGSFIPSQVTPDEAVSNFNYHRDYLRNVASPSNNIRSAVDCENLKPFSAGASVMDNQTLEGQISSSRPSDHFKHLEMDWIYAEEEPQVRCDAMHAQYDKNLVFQKRGDDFRERQLMQQLFYKTKYLKSDDQHILPSNETPISPTFMLVNNNSNNNTIASFTDESLDSGLSSDHSGLCRLSLSDASSLAGISSTQPQSICFEPLKIREKDADASNLQDVSNVGSISSIGFKSRKDRFTDDDEAELDLVVEDKKPNKNLINLSLLHNYDVVFGEGLKYDNDDDDDDDDDDDCSCGKCVRCKSESKLGRELDSPWIANNKLLNSNNTHLSCYRPRDHSLHRRHNVLLPKEEIQSPEFQPPHKHHHHQVQSPTLEDLPWFSLDPFVDKNDRKDKFHHWLNTSISQTLHRPLSAYEDIRGSSAIFRRGRCDFDLDFRHPVSKKPSTTIHCYGNNSLFEHHHHHNQCLPSLFHHLVKRDDDDLQKKRQLANHLYHLNYHNNPNPYNHVKKSEDNDGDDDDLGAVLRRYLIRRRNRDAGSEGTKQLESTRDHAIEDFDWLRYCRCPTSIGRMYT